MMTVDRDGDDTLFADAAQALLADHSTPDRIRAIEAGDAGDRLWSRLDEAGFGDALVPEADGGAGLALNEVFAIWVLCGRHALAVPLAETMVARALLARSGVARPAGPIALAEGRLDEAGGLHCGVVALGRVAASVLVQQAGSWLLLPTGEASAEPVAFCLDRRMAWSADVVSDAPRLQPPGQTDLRALQACAVAAQLAGLLSTVFERTLQYANERVQFGRPIGRFQAIQHQLAVMSEQVFAARMAAQLGCRDDPGGWLQPSRLRVATAKARTSQAALAVAEASHSIHGAIGFTAEYDLQLFTRRLHHGRQTAGSESYWQDVAGRILVDEHRGLALDVLRSLTDLPEQATTT